MPDLNVALLLLAAPLVSASTPMPEPMQAQAPTRTRAQISLDINRTQMAINQMKYQLEIERRHYKPNMDSIQAIAIQIAHSEEYLRRLWDEFNRAPY